MRKLKEGHSRREFLAGTRIFKIEGKYEIEGCGRDSWDQKKADY